MRATILSARGLFWACLGLVLAIGVPGVRAEGNTRKATPRDIAIQAVNPLPAFQVRVSVDHPDRTYHDGEEVIVRVRSEKEGYLYLLYLNVEGKAKVLFPNQYQPDNKIPAGQDVIVPDPKATFRLRVRAPFGTEYLKAIVSTEPIKDLDADKLAQANVTDLDRGKCARLFKDLGVEPVETVKPGPGGTEEPAQGETPGQHEPNAKFKDWAEHQVEIITLPADGKPTTKAQRLGIFIGISKFQDPKIRQLKVSDRDAEELAQVMKDHCGLTDAIVLTNEQATLKNIEEAIRIRAAQTTRPGDTVFLFWSGHGGRVANTDGTEPDGFDEYLVPYDGELGPVDRIRATMLMDKTFGRWVQALDGRKLVVILDACHSGGQAAGAPKGLGATSGKGLGSDKKYQRNTFKGLSNDPREGKKDFFMAWAFRSLAKDIGQKDAAVLASCKASEISFERRDGDLSVMTYFLIQDLKDASGPVTLTDAFGYLKDKVPSFVEQNYDGASQTPILADQTTPPTYLKP